MTYFSVRNSATLLGLIALPFSGGVAMGQAGQITATPCKAPTGNSEALTLAATGSDTDKVMILDEDQGHLSRVSRQDLGQKTIYQWRVYFQQTSDVNQVKSPWGMIVAATEQEALRQLSRHEAIEQEMNGMMSKAGRPSVLSNYIGPFAVPMNLPTSPDLKLLEAGLRTYEKKLGFGKNASSLDEYSDRVSFLTDYRTASRLLAQLRAQGADSWSRETLAKDPTYAKYYQSIESLKRSSKWLPNKSGETFPLQSAHFSVRFGKGDSGLTSQSAAPTVAGQTNPPLRFEIAASPSTPASAPPAAAPPARAPAAEAQVDPKTVPFGKWVQGNPGKIYSPYSNNTSPSDAVSVAQLAFGSILNCPYTGKLMRVPLQLPPQGFHNVGELCREFGIDCPSVGE